MSKFLKYKSIFIHNAYSYYINIHNEKFQFNIAQTDSETYAKTLCIQYFLNFNGTAMTYFKKYIQNPLLLSIDNSNAFKIQLYNKTMKFYFGMTKLIYLIKLRYQRKYNDKNICLQEFHKDKYIIINENNTNYVFDCSEISKICNNSLIYLDESNRLVVQKIKNPYTNLQFTLHNLYSIYFKLKDNNLLTFAFDIFYKNNFDVYHIYTDYHYAFLKNALKLKYRNFNSTIKCEIICNMVDEYDYINYKNLPSHLLLSLFHDSGEHYFVMNTLEEQGYLYLYYFDKKISKCLHVTQQKYPKLGRKIYYRNIDSSYASYIYIHPALLFTHFSE
jgi:hypothetical protein